MSSKRIFISVANEEHSAFRSQLTDLLRRTQFFDVVIQPEFPHTAADTVRKLDTLIKTCDLTVHIVGRHPGSRANADAVTDFFDHTSRDTFLDKHPNAKALLGDFSHLTYFQWEPWLALHRGKDVLVYGTPGHEAKTFPQRDHFDALYLARKHAATLLDAERRCAQIVADVCNHFGILPSGQPEQKIALSRLVSRHTGPESIGEFLGREDELKVLDEAWATPSTNVLSIIAWGGVGKTALLAEWTDRCFVQRAWKDDTGQPDPLFYFDWTFYDQGTRSDDTTHAGAASVDSFFDTALRFFGDPEPHLPGKGARLAALIQKHRTLLVLDGLEPMQYPPNHPQAGQITDPDLHALLATLAQKNPGLCVITSRQALTGLRRVDRHDLDELPEAIAIRLLQKLGVIGTEADLAAAVRDYFGHALSLIVLGRFLSVKGGDIRLRDTIKLERANERRPETTTRNAWHVLEAYEQWLAGPDGRAEDVQALRLTGLFDRPASPDCLDALRRAPAIPGLTDHLVPLDDDAWNAVLLRLHEASLIQLRYPPREPNSLAPRHEARQVPLDAHPLIREYFAKRIRYLNRKRWWHFFMPSLLTDLQAAHSILALHLIHVAPKVTEFSALQRVSSDIGSTRWSDESLPTLNDIQPLYQAIFHACQAGSQRLAMLIYRDRILRGTGQHGYYSTQKLGAVSADLAAIALLFEQQWTKVSSNIDEADQTFLLIEAGKHLGSLGRISEAVVPIRTASVKAAETQNWKLASMSKFHLCRLELLLGQLEEALNSGQCAIAFAKRNEDEDCMTFLKTHREAKSQGIPSFFCDRSDFSDWRQSVGSLSTTASVLHQLGRIVEARSFFAEARTIQREDHPKHFRLLTSIGGFHFCELLLDGCERAVWLAGEVASVHIASLVKVERYAKLTLKRMIDDGSRLDIALNHLTRARVTLYRALLESHCPSSIFNLHLLPALDGLREAGRVCDLPLALLTAALHHHAIMGDPETAQGFLDEAQQIAERGPMPLYLADVHLHRARLFHDKAELHRARALIEKHGYWRRKEELEDAETAAVNW